MMPNVGVSEVAWHFLLAKVAGCETHVELDRLAANVRAVHGDGDGMKIIHRAIAERRRELEARG